ncbi:Signal transduction histidine-protein kinase/phosphatase DegS [Nonomuraea coxensis DSM 45129]|uniref:histidine kinase n=1 Tax=Nonomuraea coxensis DSM 45129 TaxID=1122611 RepID=A0ABX8UDJ2_9ACTN|nr:sensor histidine kinase [Nonomuraea coxensis]QYC44758.1 Signal transduction histidine-protein kinase/phosphatase DegS [Nonomuraea coxensis DSM 45129]
MKVPRPWSARAWLDTAHVMIGLPVAVLLAGSTIVAIVVPPVLRGGLPLFTRLQRSRFEVFLGARIPPVHTPGNLRSAVTWRQIGYHLLSPVVGLVGAVLVALTWGGAVVGLLAFLPARIERPPLQFEFDLRDGRVVVVFMAAGFALLLLAPVLARGMAALDLFVARTLLGPSRSELGQRIETLTESRAGVIDAADAERRRIERDLHDGAQQRLVSLAMNLGLARATLTDLPEPAREAIERAHEEAKQALKELRDFVRGLHPAVLNDQGLDAALSGVAARAPFPVRLRVDIERRVTPTIEAVAFFIVSEALTNIAKHAAAKRAEVSVRREHDRLHVLVHDDGCGGARMDAGTGLRGLAQRVDAVDGTLRLSSPLGGPTTIEVDLPCA